MPITNTALALKDLPPPPSGKTGWPWTEQIQPVPARMPDGTAWPRVSIVTPSYNYGRFIEETIRSVLLQGYPNLEYILIDGGSVDNTVSIIHRYEKYLTYWESEPDQGQTDAINKGFERSTGDIFVWLNADDAYAASNCLQRVAALYKRGYEFIVGQCLYVSLTSNSIGEEFQRKAIPVSFKEYLRYWSCTILHQPSVFLAMNIAAMCFPLDNKLFYAMDYQLFLKALSFKPKSIWLEEILSKANLHSDNKTLTRPSDSSEFHQIALIESKKLPLIQRKCFRTELDNNVVIQSIISKEESPSFWEIITLLISKQTLLSSKLFCKILIKSAVGESLYSSLKQIVIRS